MQNDDSLFFFFFFRHYDTYLGRMNRGALLGLGRAKRDLRVPNDNSLLGPEPPTAICLLVELPMWQHFLEMFFNKSRP